MTPNERMNPREDNAPPDDPAAAARRLVSRRALVRAGWTVPVVLALSVPVNAFAQYACAHSDVPATAHEDIPASAHVDDTNEPHYDVPATVHADIAATAHVDADVCDG